MTFKKLPGRRDKRGRLVCDCGGYCFPHRKFGGACYNGPRADYYAALRAGISDADAAADFIWADKLLTTPQQVLQTFRRKL
jgi:hypothetical protein